MFSPYHYAFQNVVKYVAICNGFHFMKKIVFDEK